MARDKKIETEEEKKAREVIEGIAENIQSLSRSVTALIGGKFKKESLVILLAHTTKLPQYQITSVLNALSNLERDHLK